MKERARSLRQAIGSTDQLVRRATWAEWFDNNPLLVLLGNLVALDQSGITPRVVEDVISKGKDRPLQPCGPRPGTTSVPERDHHSAALARTLQCRAQDASQTCTLAPASAPPHQCDTSS